MFVNQVALSQPSYNYNSLYMCCTCAVHVLYMYIRVVYSVTARQIELMGVHGQQLAYSIITARLKVEATTLTPHTLQPHAKNSLHTVNTTSTFTQQQGYSTVSGNAWFGSCQFLVLPHCANSVLYPIVMQRGSVFLLLVHPQAQMNTVNLEFLVKGTQVADCLECLIPPL